MEQYTLLDIMAHTLSEVACLQVKQEPVTRTLTITVNRTPTERANETCESTLPKVVEVCGRRWRAAPTLPTD